MTTESNITIKDLLEAGVHFGHKSAAANPKMSKYIFIKRRGVHIIDLQKTSLLLEKAFNYIKNVAANGGKILFVGTKKQARELIRTKVQETDHFYMTHRWVGGLLTNFEVVRQSIEQLKNLNDILENPEKQRPYIKKELFKMKKKRDHLNQTFEGVLKMEKLPDAIFVVDVFSEDNCVREANLSGVPVCAMVDTNSNPENVDVVIPSNDDAVRSISLFVGKVVEAIQVGTEIYKSNQNELSLFAEMRQEEQQREKNTKDQDSKKSEVAVVENSQGNAQDVIDTEVETKVGFKTETKIGTEVEVETITEIEDKTKTENEAESEKDQ